MLCHSVFSLRSPEFLSRQVSEVARVKLTTGSPELSRRTSGSLPRFPTRMTLLTLPAMVHSLPPVAGRAFTREMLSRNRRSPGAQSHVCPHLAARGAWELARSQLH